MLALLVACQRPAATPLPPVGGGVCQDLAYVFFLVARNKDEGLSKREQLAMAEAGVENPFAADPDRTRHYWSRVIDFVYRDPDADAQEVRSRVEGDCRVNERGQAVLLWPRE
jgi:hypothetical protein